MNKNIGIIIGFVVLSIIGGAYVSMNDKDDVMMKDKVNNSAMMNSEDQTMMQKTGDTMMKSGSYETYSLEKIALASSTHNVILFFRAGWCPTCRSVDADIKSHLSQIPSSLSILDVNYDDSSALKQKYGVTYQHTFVQVDKDGTLIKKWSASPTLAAIVAEVK